MQKISTMRTSGKKISKGSSRSGWIWEIVAVLTAFWMKPAKSSWNRKCPQPRKQWSRPLKGCRGVA